MHPTDQQQNNFFIFCHIIVLGLTSLTSSDYFQFSINKNIRGHTYKLYILQNSCNIRQKFLSHRILTVWNSLPANTDFSSMAQPAAICYLTTNTHYDPEAVTVYRGHGRTLYTCPRKLSHVC